ncbi:hypothetical protein [Lactiplantibacillus plantarum]|uniref:hypothetical protein n=1 Tax=Lactiplantibacillus plantarum TaxID=1590 RepID=UPI000AC5EBD3|nr:hypothetical protein [Lactiplantibacillus plantarum]
MQKASVLPVNNWKRVQKKPSLVSANDGIMEYLFNANIYIILKLVCWQVKE